MQNSAENDERVMTLVRAALRVPAVDRAELLRVASEGAADLYSEAVRVVEWEERMGDFLRQPLINFIDLEASEPPQPPFLPGESISHRFAILREVGRGGMGIVYEAFDRKRNQRIAIKCAQPGFGRLLSPELEGALKVRHPNICLVNEIHTTQTKFGELDFLTMEFLEGETLSTRLAREGKLPPEESLEVARQLCAGLTAAHDNGILHRDLKAANVILNRREDDSLRAAITDFGLATDTRLDSALDGGTPCYMAPELWRGEKASRASDVYALGVILYEMVTGRQPFTVDKTPERSSAPPELPSALNKDLDARWDKALLPCFDPAPAARPKADDVLAVFDKRPLWRSPAVAVAVMALVALLAGFRQPLMKLFKPADIRLAILPLQAPPDLQEMGNGVLQDVAERIKRSQRSGATLTVIPPSEAARNNVHNPGEAHDVLHATHALQIAVHREAADLIADESVIDLATQVHLRDFSGRYTLTTRGDMPTALAGSVANVLRLQQLRADRISSPATVSYDRGLSLLHQEHYAYDEAIVQFEDASRLDPHSPLPFAGLAEAHIGKFKLNKQPGELEGARTALHAAEALNPDSVTVRLASGALNEVTGQNEKALEDYRRVLELEPRSVEGFLRVARTYEAVNMPDAALENYRKAIALQPDYYEAYEWLGTFYYYAGKYSEAAEQFQRAIERAPGRWSAYFNLGAVLDVLNRDDEAVAALRRSLSLKRTARALNSLGAIMAYQWKDQKAADFYQEAVDMEPGNYKYRLNLADSYRRLGRGSDAISQYHAGTKLVLAELQQNPRLGATRAFLGYFKTRLADKKGAKEEIAQALNLAPSDSQVLRCAILAYEALGERNRALEIAASAPKELLLELKRHPDLADFSHDSRYIDLLSLKKGG